VILPKDGYEAMMLINAMANNNQIAGVSYSTKIINGQIVLTAIKAHMMTPIKIEGVGAQVKAGQLLKMPVNTG